MPRGVLIVLSLVAVSALGCSSSGSDADSSTTRPQGRGTTTSAPATTTTTEPRPEPVPVEEEGAYVESLAMALIAGGGEGLKPTLSEEQAMCFAPEWVAIATPERLAAVGVGSGDLASPDFDLRNAGMSKVKARQAVNALDACGVGTSDLVAAALTAEMDAAQAECVSSNLDPIKVKDLLAGAFTDEINLQQVRQDLMVSTALNC